MEGLWCGKVPDGVPQLEGSDKLSGKVAHDRGQQVLRPPETLSAETDGCTRRNSLHSLHAPARPPRVSRCIQSAGKKETLCPASLHWQSAAAAALLLHYPISNVGAQRHVTGALAADAGGQL